jgi:hypothetical protein
VNLFFGICPPGAEVQRDLLDNPKAFYVVGVQVGEQQVLDTANIEAIQ